MLKKSMLLILSFFLLVCGCNKNVVRTHNKLILSYDIIVNESYDNVKYIGKCLEDALEEIGVEDPNIYFTSEKVYIKITSEDEIDINEIKNVIEKTSKVELSFRDFENNLLATGEEILKDVGATLSEEVDQYGYPIILLNIKDTQKLSSITEQVSSLSDNHLVVWLGFEEGDDYANIKTDASVAKKIIYNATVAEKLDDDQISVTGQFSKTAAESTVALINSGTLNYDLDIVQISSMEPLVAEKSYNKILISGLIAIILVVLFLSVKYKVGGIVASLVLLLDLFLTLTLFVTMKGVVNQQSIAALIVAMGIAVDAIVVLLERTNNELYNDKNLQRALAKGYKKSISSIVDANIIMLVMSIVVFFLGTSASSFALMLSLSSVCSLITMTLCLNLFLSYVAKIVAKPTLFGAKSIYLENKEEYINHKNNASNPLKNTKKYFTGVGVFSIVAIIVMLVFQLAMGEMFNYNRTISNNSSITIVSHKDYFKDNDHIMSFFGEEDLSIELTGISTSEFKEDGVTKYKVTVYTDDSITDKENDITNKVIKNFDKNEEYVENYELYINSINSKSTSVSLLTALYTVGVGLLIVGVYLALRYRYTYALAAIASSIASIVLVALFFGFTRIKIGSDIVTSIFAIAVFGLNTLIVSFSRLREMIGNNGKKYISNEERFEAVRKSVIATLPRTLITTLIVTIISVVLLSFSSLNNYSFYVALIVGLIISAVNAIFVSNHVWLFFEKLSDKKKRTFKPKKKNTKFKELEEQVFVGIND